MSLNINSDKKRAQDDLATIWNDNDLIENNFQASIHKVEV